MPIEDEIKLYMALSSLTLTGREISSTISRASARALLKADIMTTGWMFRSNCGKACARISPAAMCQNRRFISPYRLVHFKYLIL